MEVFKMARKRRNEGPEKQGLREMMSVISEEAHDREL